MGRIVVVALISLACLSVCYADISAAESRFESEFLHKLNAKRKDKGLATFNINTDMTVGAHNWAQHLADTGEFATSHKDKYFQLIHRKEGHDYTTNELLSSWLKGNSNILYNGNLKQMGLGLGWGSKGERVAVAFFIW